MVFLVKHPKGRVVPAGGAHRKADTDGQRIWGVTEPKAHKPSVTGGATRAAGATVQTGQAQSGGPRSTGS